MAPLVADNKMSGGTYGSELFAEWRPASTFKLNGAYTFLRMDINRDRDSLDTTSPDPAAPVHGTSSPSVPRSTWRRTSSRISAGAMWEASPDWRFPATTRWMPISDGPPLKRLNFSISGQNLTNNEHLEFRPDFIATAPTVVKRTYQVTARWAFSGQRRPRSGHHHWTPRYIDHETRRTATRRSRHRAGRPSRQRERSGSEFRRNLGIPDQGRVDLQLRQARRVAGEPSGAEDSRSSSASSATTRSPAYQPHGQREEIDDRPLLVRRLKSKHVNDCGCQLLFVAAAESAHADDVIQSQGKAPVLTIAEAPDFAARGGMIALVLQDSKVRFIVNVHAAAQAGLSISSRLLALATVVHTSR